MAKSSNFTASDIRKHGWDFGLGIHTILVSAPDFIEHLKSADIVACMYGLDYSKLLHSTLPFIALVGKNRTAAREAFKELHRWCEVSDGDAIHLSIVINKKVGYRVGIWPDAYKLIHRLSGFDRVTKPILTLPAWAKPFDTKNPWLEKLLQYSRQPLSPFLLTVMSYSRDVASLTQITPPDSPTPGLPQGFEPIDDFPSILKFNLEIETEANAAKNPNTSFLMSYTNRKKVKKQIKKSRKELKKKHIATSSEINSERRRLLEYFFPVTIERARQHNLTGRITNSDVSPDIAPWQVEQAICNAVLSRELTHGNSHYQGIDSDTLRASITDGLKSHFELADGKSALVQNLTNEEIIHQVTLDSLALLKGLDVKCTNLPPSRIVKLLKQRRLFSARPVAKE